MLWQDIGLIGRRNFLEKLLPDLIDYKVHVLMESPDPGVGRTALLEWCQEQLRKRGRKCCLINVGMNNAVLFNSIIKEFEIDVNPDSKDKDKKAVKMTPRELEESVLQSTGHVLLLDDIGRMRADKITLFSSLAKRHKLVMTMRKIGRNEELRRFLWGVKRHKIKRLDGESCIKIAEQMVIKAGSKLDPAEVGKNAFGLVGKIEAMIAKGAIIFDDYKTKEEEIDLAPWVIGAIAFMAVFRLIGRHMGASDLALLGTAIMLIVRFVIMPFLRAGRKRN